MCMSEMQRFITSTGQIEPAMIPVRSEDRSWSANVGWFCMAMNIVGTPYTAVQRSSAIAPQRRPGVEAGRRDHHRGAVGGAAEVAHHHAEAVVEGHRDAQPVGLGEVDRLGDEVAVVEDVAVREGRALRVAGRARGVLDVDRVVGCERPHPVVHDVGVDPLPRGDHVGPVAGADVDDALQARRVGGGLRDHRAVVAGLEALGRDQHPQPRVVDRVGELVGPVGRVDVDEDGPDLRRGELGDRPLRTARRPHPDPVALGDPAGDQAAGEEVDVVVERPIGPAAPRGELDEGLAVGVRRHRAVEVVPDGLVEEGHVGLASRVGLHVSDPSRARRRGARLDGARLSKAWDRACEVPTGASKPEPSPGSSPATPACSGHRTGPGHPPATSSACRPTAAARRRDGPARSRWSSPGP